MNNISYMAIMTNDPKRAASLYEEKTGYKPTVLLCRPGFSSEPHPLISESRNAAWGLFLVSYFIKPNDVKDSKAEVIYNKKRVIPEIETPQKKVDLSLKINKVGRPAKTEAYCPHCRGQIYNFDDLGFWYGWNLGITPPYWNDLREYVLRRDKYKCQKCGKTFPAALLQAHHIEPKEYDGIDSARNLQTLCVDCHAEHKPIFEDEEP